MDLILSTHTHSRSGPVLVGICAYFYHYTISSESSASVVSPGHCSTTSTTLSVTSVAAAAQFKRNVFIMIKVGCYTYLAATTILFKRNWKKI